MWHTSIVLATDACSTCIGQKSEKGVKACLSVAFRVSIDEALVADLNAQFHAQDISPLVHAGRPTIEICIAYWAKFLSCSFSVLHKCIKCLECLASWQSSFLCSCRWPSASQAVLC